MTLLEKSISEIYESVFDCADTKRIDYRLMVNSINTRKLNIFIDKDKNPFQFDNSQDIISYCKGTSWSKTSSSKEELIGSVNIDFVFAYKNDFKEVSTFIKGLRIKDYTINKIETDPVIIFRNYWNIAETDARFPREYNALVIQTTLTNVELNQFL